MTHLLVHHRVADFDVWKDGYDGHRSARDAGGLEELRLMRGIDDPNDVVLLFKVVDEAKARAFIDSADLQSRMQQVGVIGKPAIVFLDDVA